MDSVLLHRWIDARDAEAFRELAQKYLPMVYATCLRILREPGDAEDVTQDCFETLAGIREKAPSQLGPWLHRVATNKSLNFIRSCNRRARREDELARATDNSADGSHDDIYSLVDECIAKLPDELRVPLVTHFFEDQTHDAIAHSLGISRSAVTHRIGRAIDRIREDLRRRGHASPAFAVGASLESIRMRPIAVPVALEHVVAKLAIGGVTPAAGGAAAAAVGAGVVKGALLMTMTQKTLIGVGAIAAIVAVSMITLRANRERTPMQPAVSAQAPIEVQAPPPPPAKTAAPLAKPEIRTDLAPARDEKRVQPPGHLTVFVYDNTGAPAAGAKVTLRYSESSDPAVKPGTSFEETTDADGTATFSDMAWGWAWLLAERGTTCSQQWLLLFHAQEYSKEVVLMLQQTGQIAGKVVDDQGVPIARARVVPSEKDLSGVGTSQEYPDAQMSDGEGRFTFPRLPAGSYRFRATAEGYAAGDSEPVLTDGNAEAVVRLAAGSSISGTVRNATTRTAVSGFPVVMRRKDSNERAKTIETESAGTFEFTGLTEGSYQLYSGNQTMVFADGKVDVEVPRAAPISGLELLTQDGVTISGRVLHENSEDPVANAIVEFTSSTSVYGKRSSLPTDAGGNYVVVGVGPGANYFTVTSNYSYLSPRLTLNVPIQGAVEKFDIHVPPTTTVDGVVLDQRGLPVAGASVDATAWKTGIGQEGHARGLSDQDGTFSLTCLFTGPGYQLVVMASSQRGKSGSMEPITIPANGVRGIVLRLTDKPSASIAGRVVNGNGDPVFAWVNARTANERFEFSADEEEAWRNSPERWLASGGSARTDVNGQFVIMSLREGDYDLFVGEHNPSGYQTMDQKAGNVTLQTRQHMAGVELVLDAGIGDITGVVTDEQGRPITDAYIGAQVDVDSQELDCRSDQSGKFRLANLQDEFYLVRINKEGYKGQRIRSVASGEKLKVVLVPITDETPHEVGRPSSP